MIATVTHARVRAAQGDLAGARRVLMEILRHTPDHVEAQELLLRFAGRGDPAPVATPPESLRPPQAADVASLAKSFRRKLAPSGTVPRPDIERLRGWLKRVSDPSR